MILILSMRRGVFMAPNRTCPECHLTFEAPLPETGILACPLCNTLFSAPSPSDPAPTTPAPVTSGRQVLRGVLAVAALLFLAGGLVYAYHLMGGISQRSVAVPAPTEPARAPRVAEPPAVVEVIPSVPVTPAPAATVRRPRPSSRPPELKPFTIAAGPRRPLTLAERVNAAIDRGVAFLRMHHKEHDQYRRYLGLLGLTLLECGIPADDPSVQEIAAWIRAQQRDLTQTYELTLAILFLDRLGESRDRGLIRTFGQRLLEGQLDGGSWTYSCLMNEKRRGSRMWPATMPFWKGAPAGKRADVSRRLRYRGDNSNTQFAILGLWVAQRHGVSVRSALLANEQYFRATQYPDGCWTYHPSTRTWRDSMTCAGLMSLAMRHGVNGGQGRHNSSGQRLFIQDVAMRRGLDYLAQSLNKVSRIGQRINGVEARDALYFLWSLERMAVIYDLKRIGNREWYPWAAEMLVETQHADGRWQSGMGEPVGTCFALLILKRSNLAADLQLAVQERPGSPMLEATGPIILQGRDAILGQTARPRTPSLLPGTAGSATTSPALGPSITRTPKNR